MLVIRMFIPHMSLLIVCAIHSVFRFRRLIALLGWISYATAMICRALWIPRKSDSFRVISGIPRATATAAMRMSKRHGFGFCPAARTFAHRAP